MVLSKNNVAKNIGNASPTVVTKIHSMPWLKHATTPKDSDCREKADAKMLKPSAVSKDNDQSTSEKKNKKKNVRNKNKKGTNAEAPKNIGAMDKSNNAAKKTNGRRDEKYTRLPVSQGYIGGEKNAWSGGTKSLFPNSGEAARTNELSEEEQMKLALEASLETAMLEQCAIDSPKDDGETVDDKSDSEDENIWDGVHQNLPPANSEESIKSFDANNNAGANKSQISTIETKNIEDKIASSDVSTVPKIEPTSEIQKKIVPLDVPITPPIVPKFIDCFGRMDGYSEKHLYMGKGTRMKEENLRRQVQQQRSSNGSQQNQYYGSGPQNSYPPRSAPAPMHDNYGAAKGSNDRRGREPPFPFPRDSQRPKNPPVVGDNSRNDNYGRVKQWNDSNRHGLPSQDSHYQKNPYVVEDNSRNDNHGRAKQWNDTNRHSLPSQDSHRPKYSQSADENSHNDRSQRRSVANAPPNYRSYDASKNPYKFQRDPNSRNAANSDKEGSQKSDENHHDDDYRSDTVANRDNREVEIPSLMATKIDNPTCMVTIAQESARPVDRSEVKTLEEPPEKIESEIRKEIEEFPENPKSHFRLSDFNSRLNTPHEQVSLPIDPISSCSSASSFIDAPLAGYDSCQKTEMQIHPPMFTVPPPGFECLESVRHSCGNAAYVVPVESSLSTSPFPMIPQNSIEPPNANTPEIGNTLPIPKADLYARIKITDPMLYELLMQKEELDGVRKNSPTIPEVQQELPIPQNSSQDSRNLYDLPTGQQQQQLRRQNDLLNPNAKQFSPISEQSWIAMNQPEPMSSYSRVANYDPPSMPYQHQYAGLPQDIQRQDNSMWNHPTNPNMFHNTEQSAQQHVHASVTDATPTAILGRHNYMVSEKNFPFRNASCAMTIPQLNDDYPRCPPSGYENIPMVTQRQVPYRPSLPQCGIAPNHFCSAPCAASYGSQNQAPTNKCAGCSHPAKLHQQYAEFMAMYHNNMNPGNIDVRRVNDDQHLPISSQDCQNSETNSIMQSEIPYVAPTIRQGVLHDNKPNVGRGRARNLNNKK